MPAQIIANICAAIGSVISIIGLLKLCVALVSGGTMILPPGWTSDRLRRFHRLRAVLWITGPLSWICWVLVQILTHSRPLFSNGLIETDTAFMAGLMGSYIFIWLQALLPRDYSQHGRPMLLVINAFALSMLTLILSLIVGGLAIFFWSP